MSFQHFGLSTEILRAINEQGYEKPTPIQNKAIPLILGGRDIMASAQTGTGKTACFTLPLLQHICNSPKKSEKPAIRALVITPTRELAEQVGVSVRTYGRHMSLKSTVIYGGVNINLQKTRLRKGVDVLVCTPGRLLDHIRQQTVDLSKIDIFVLDEADRMLDMGFVHDIRKILTVMPENKSRQNLLFSATFSDEIKLLADRLLNQPEWIQDEKRNSAAKMVEQKVYHVDKERKRELLSHRIGMLNWRQVLVFTRTKHGANRLADQLNKDGLKSKAIHSDKTQGARRRALEEFKLGKTRVLVATDIMARGLDIDQLPFVVNYDLPDVPEDYIHRIGRTGRAGKVGMAVSLVSGGEKKQLHNIERLLKREIPKEVLEGYEPDPNKKTKSFKREKGELDPSRKKKNDENQKKKKIMKKKKKWNPSKKSFSKRKFKTSS